MKSNILVGNYIEFGQFKSIRSRAGIKWSKTIRNKNKESELKSTSKLIQLQTMESQRKAEQLATDIIETVKTSIENTNGLVNGSMAAEFPDQRNA